jgi:hypothetical protein
MLANFGGSFTEAVCPCSSGWCRAKVRVSLALQLLQALQALQLLASCKTS